MDQIDGSQTWLFLGRFNTEFTGVYSKHVETDFGGGSQVSVDFRGYQVIVVGGQLCFSNFIVPTNYLGDLLKILMPMLLIHEPHSSSQQERTLKVSFS